MKKRLFVLAAVMMLFVVYCVGAQAAALPDPLAFANGMATQSGSDVRGNMLSWTYQSEENLYEVFREYVGLLENREDLKRRGTLAPDDPNLIEMYWYDYIGKESISPCQLKIKSVDWQGEFDVYVRCTKNNGKYFITLYASQGFRLIDSGERAGVEGKTPAAEPAAQATAKPTTKPTAKPAETVSCGSCGGDGYAEKSCSSCSGSGDTRCGSCSGDGEKDCISCSGKGYDRCSGCGGDGKNRCSSCFGSGERSGKRCSSCSGSGDKRCSSCSGSGKKTCSACRGSGDRKCSSCGGDGKKDCSICSGRGKKSTICSSCSGSGKAKK